MGYKATAPEIPQLSQPSMEPELAIVVVETGKVKKEITKATALARTQQTSAKKKKKKKVVKYPGGKRAKGQHKSKAMKASGKKTAAMMKKKGIGLFATKTLSADLAAICGKNKMPRTEVTKAIWVYIKKNKLSKGRTITPDAKLKKVLPSASFSMFKMPGMLSKHIK